MYQILLNPKTNPQQKSAITIGNFDGLHLGHMQLLQALNEVASKHNFRRIVLTFEPLPLEYFCEQNSQPRPTRLGLLRDKFLILRQLGYIDELVILRFNAQVANLPADQFIQQLLKACLNVEHVVVGHDFKFGQGGVGGIRDFAQQNISHTIIPPYKIGNKRVSSSLIRDFAQQNELAQVTRYLGRNLHYTSKVVHGNHLGRKFGVPTINLSLGRNQPALWGVYIARAHIEGKSYNAVANIGKNPTINDLNHNKLEAHLLDVNLDLYGKIATIEIIKFMRKELKFQDMDSLFAQIQHDLQEARNYFSINQIGQGN
jgi:riboflavin kinase/FMN adenylyltransferase